MKGVVITPILAAIFAMMVTHSGPIAAGAFFAVIFVEVLVIVNTVRGRKTDA